MWLFFKKCSFIIIFFHKVFAFKTFLLKIYRFYNYTSILDFSIEKSSDICLLYTNVVAYVTFP